VYIQLQLQFLARQSRATHKGARGSCVPCQILVVGAVHPRLVLSGYAGGALHSSGPASAGRQSGPAHRSRFEHASIFDRRPVLQQQLAAGTVGTPGALYAMCLLTECLHRSTH
jgi:hypothetical protein